MSWISWVCFGICLAIIVSVFKRGADPLSPARVFGFIWSLSIGLTELKFSSFQHVWTFDSWILLLIAIIAFLTGTFIAYILNLDRKLIPLVKMRRLFRTEEVRESRLFWLICLSFVVYVISYLINYMMRGWLPIFTIGTALSRVDFNVTGLTFFLYSVSFIIYFTILYYLLVRGNKNKKIFLAFICLIAVASNLLLLSRYQFVMAMILCFSILYYATPYIKLRTTVYSIAMATGFFYWISSIRVSHLVATFLYTVSRMKFSKAYAFLTEPYMYVVMNLENFSRSVNMLDYHTYGYYNFDFITAITGLKYWIYEYFKMDRSPFLVSTYNTYTAFWWFYLDFGVLGLAIIPLLLGFGSGMFYYRMRCGPTVKNITAYGVVIFIIAFTFFNLPTSFLWFEYNLLAIYLILRWTINPQKVRG
jgi:oligosaccharide repeat unit polymerase